MRLLLAILSLVCALPAFGATGDILGALVDTNGYMLRLRISGLDVGGTYNLGWHSNHVVSATNTLRLWVASPGFDDAGNSNNSLRMVMATAPIPTNATVATPYYEQSADGETWITVGLTSLVRSEDAILGMDSLAGFYTSGGTPTAAAVGLGVTNTSAVSWAVNRTIANWSWPPAYYAVTNATADLRVIAFHISAQDAKPVRYVDFWAVDASGNRSPTNRVTTPIIRSGLGDLVPVVEYCGDVDYSGLTQGVLVTNYFKAVPWHGVAASVCDASDEVNILRPYYYAPRITFNNRLQTYGRSYAVVDASGGNDTSGIVVSNWTGAIAPFATIGKAASSMQSSNALWYSRTNIGNGTIYLTNGSHAYRGAAPSATIQRGQTYVTIEPYPGLDYSTVDITNSSSSGDIGDLILFRGIGFRPKTVSNTAYGNLVDHVWVDGCWLDSTNAGAAVWTDCTNVYYTRNTFTNWSGRLTHPGTSGTGANTHMALIRANAFRGFHRNTAPHVMVGNHKSLTNNYSPEQLVVICAPGFSGETNQNDGAIVAFNKLMGCKFDGNDVVKIAGETNIAYGIAIVQNVIEAAQQGSSGQTAAIGTVKYTNLSTTNVLSWYNTWIGGKLNVYYDYTNGTHWAIGCSHASDYTEDWNQKTGNFAPLSLVGYGGWPVKYGVDHDAHVSSEITGAPAEFMARFPGPGGFMSDWEMTNSWAAHVNRAGYYFRSGNGPGDGNYQLLTQSPLFKFRAGRVRLPYDINGVSRSRFDPPGAHAAGAARRGSQF